MKAMRVYHYEYDTNNWLEGTNWPPLHNLTQRGKVSQISYSRVHVLQHCIAWCFKNLTVEVEKVSFRQSTGTVAVLATVEQRWRNVRTCIAKWVH